MRLFGSRRAREDQPVSSHDVALESALVLIDEEPPPGNDGETTAPATKNVIAREMGSHVSAGKLRDVWLKRLSLGYGLTSDGMEDDLWFWINAWPALAAVRLGLAAHPFTATCGGYADSAYWSLESRTEDHRQVMREINAAFGVQ